MQVLKGTGDTELNERCQNLVENEVYCCVTGLVDALLWTESDYINIDDIQNFHKKSEDDDELIPQEIFEWWKVSKMLLDDLKELGEPVIEHENLWGRTCTGQAIYLDGTIRQVIRMIDERI